MRLKINGKNQDIEEAKLIDLLKSKSIEPRMVTIELNGKMVDRAHLDQTPLQEGDELELIYFMGGGAKGKTSVTKHASDITTLIGKTPLIEIKYFSKPPAARIFAKVEYFNPGGSVKDRICVSMIEAAEASGRLKPGMTIVEPTSGNTGIGLALVAAVRKYKLILVMPESMSLERASLLSSYGAQLVLTPAWEGMRGAIKEAENIISQNSNYYMPGQFSNPANPEVHRQTTGPEILEALDAPVDAFVAGVGTGGTITGVGEVLKAKNPKVQIIAVEPSTCAVLSGGDPGPHKIQGIGAGFIPDILNRSIIDRVIVVTDDEAYKSAKALAREEGLLVGISSGANAWAAKQVAQELGKDKTVVTILPDTGERYISIEKYFNI